MLDHVQHLHTELAALQQTVGHELLRAHGDGVGHDHGGVFLLVAGGDVSWLFHTPLAGGLRKKQKKKKTMK